MKEADAAHHGRVVAEVVTVQFAKIGDDARQVIESVGPRGMASELHLLPWRELGEEIRRCSSTARSSSRRNLARRRDSVAPGS